MPSSRAAGARHRLVLVRSHRRVRLDAPWGHAAGRARRQPPRHHACAGLPGPGRSRGGPPGSGRAAGGPRHREQRRARLPPPLGECDGAPRDWQDAPRRGDLDDAARSVRHAVESARRGLARIELAYGLLSLAEISLRHGDRRDATERLVAEAQAALDHCRDPGVVGSLVAEMAERLGRSGDRVPRALTSGGDLTEREAAVLALLPTDLTLREVAGTLYVSLNTVKSQTRAIYRKLGVTTRSDAVVRARQLGLASLATIRVVQTGMDVEDRLPNVEPSRSETAPRPPARGRAPGRPEGVSSDTLGHLALCAPPVGTSC